MQVHDYLLSNNNNIGDNKSYRDKLSHYVKPSSSLYFCDKCERGTEG